MHGVSISTNLPAYGNFSPEELSRKVRRFAMELVLPKKEYFNTALLLYRRGSRKIIRQTYTKHSRRYCGNGFP